MSRILRWTNVSSLVLRFVLFAGVAVCAQHAGPAWAGVIHHVKADATGANNGLSWADAYTDLQAGLAAAEWGDEIWVAQGTYKPTSGTLRTVSFQLVAGVGLYGGFAGAETERGQRDWEANATILSGNIGTAGSATDNSYHVVVGESPAVLDGFTITGGNADGLGSSNRGGGMYNRSGSPIVTNCTFSSNTASHGDWGGGFGGGMYNSSSSPTVSNCAFSGNTAGGIYGGGGGMYNGSGSSPTVTNCTFSGNTASGGGGGMYNGSSGKATVTNCTFSDNTADSDGGGVYGGGTFTNCLFSSNTADSDGGGVSGSGTFANCTFSGNTGSGNGGGMYNSGSSTVTNCIFWDNSAPVGAEVYKGSGTPTFSHCDIRGCGGSGALWNPGLGTDGGGNIMGDPRFVAPANPIGPDGLWRTSDDGLRLQSDSPCIGAADPAIAPRKDILGLPRKIAPDIGAYEFDWTRTGAGPAWRLFR